MTKATDTGLRQNRVVMMMSDAELKAVDDWRFQWRIGSRGDAMRKLIQTGLSSEAVVNIMINRKLNEIA
ncbi:MAG: hypothetical protein E5X05_01490 [Mesorhizobium sp.]|nr:MAG: hypothetical protein E5X05_01490 [Mesorhizobium sp.]